MRTIDLAMAVVIVALSGCAGHHASTPSQSLAGSTPTTTAEPAATDHPVAMAGTWHCRENSIVIELAADGQWRWWESGQSRRPPEAPALTGSWFIRKAALYLRIEHTKEPPERIGPGLAFTFDVKSVTPEAMILHHMREEGDLTFRRIAEPSGAASRGQPVDSETSRMSAAAGPGG
jgi:hypothetical protein